MNPLLNVGDVVLIRDDIADLEHCNAGYVPEMQEFAGQLVTIKEIAQTSRGEPRTSGDSYLYFIEDDEDELFWSDDIFDWSYVPEEECDLDIGSLL